MSETGSFIRSSHSSVGGLDTEPANLLNHVRPKMVGGRRTQIYDLTTREGTKQLEETREV